MTYTYKSESEIYYAGAIDSADMTESQIDLIYNTTWVYSLDSFAQLVAASISLAFMERPAQLFIN